MEGIMTDNQPVQPKNTVGTGYALFQLARALRAGSQQMDADVRQQAQLRAENWAKVFEQILDGSLMVGSRTPLADVPAWATLKVLTGGFATGELLANGSLESHEQLLLERLSIVTEEENARQALNTYFLTDAGLAELQSLLTSGAYRINLPEEGALLVVAWLVQEGQIESAQKLLETLGAWFSRLRFYPIPADALRPSGSRVFLQNVGETVETLKRVESNAQMLAQKEMVCIWTPLYDQMMQLFIETVTGELPSLICDESGNWTRLDNGKFPVQGGWPCQQYPPGWFEKAAALLKEWDAASLTNQHCQRPKRPNEQFAQLHILLQRCQQNPLALSGRDVGRIRQILACYLTKRGAPNSAQCIASRQQQFKHASAPLNTEIVAVLLPRLQAFPLQAGLEDPHLVMHPVSDDEAARYQLPAGTPIPETLQRKVGRCLTETVDALVEKGLITSGDTLARVLPQMTASIRAVGFANPVARSLFSSIYTAFRRRRSLLLLNLEHQVRIEELPWVAALDLFRERNLPSRELAQQTLEEVSLLALCAFPHAILPNKLLQELSALSKTAGLDLPLVEEVAADIFMGRFSDKFLAAAHLAAGLLNNTLYATYYGINYIELPEPSTRPVNKPRSSRDNTFAELCARRAGVSLGGWKPALNGMVIEQQQILTTQNLAALFKELHIAENLGEQLDELARRCFVWICHCLQVKTNDWHAHLIQVKNSAYAWRQMIFFLALRPVSDQTAFFLWAEKHLSEQPAAFQARFRPALLGLSFAIQGHSLESQAATGAKRFLGWSQTKHWLLDQQEITRKGGFPA